MDRTARGRSLNTRRLERVLHDQYRKALEIPKRHIIGRMATGAQAQVSTESPVGVYLAQEGLRLSLWEPFLAEVGYRPFRDKTEQASIDKRTVTDRITELGGVSIRPITVHRTSLRLSRLTSVRQGAEAFLLLGYVDTALDKKGRDVTEQLYEHHDALVAEFGDEGYVDPVLHFGTLTCPHGVGTRDWLEDHLPAELEAVVPGRVVLPPVSLVRLPRLPD